VNIKPSRSIQGRLFQWRTTMKTLLIAGGLALVLSGCTPAAIVAGVPVAMEIYAAAKSTYCANATEEGRDKVRDKLTGGETVYRYCPGGK